MKRILFIVLTCIAYYSVSAQTAPVITALGPTTFCSGSNVILQSDMSSGNQWYKNGIAISGATAQNYSSTTSGSYTVKNGGLMSNSISVTVNPRPAATVTPSGSVPICAGGSRTLTVSNAGSGGSYLWNTGATTQSIIVSTAGSFNVTVTNAYGCTRTSATVATYIQPLPATPVITTDDALIFCPGGSATLTSSITSGNQWYKNGVAITGATAQNYVATTSGNYTAKVKSGTCFSSVSNTITVTVKSAPKPTVTPSGTVTVCSGSSKTLTANYISGATYLWSNGATTQSISINYADTFNVTITYPNGCSNTSNKVVTIVQQPPTAPTLTANGATTFCSGSNVILQSSPAVGYRWFKNGVLISGATAQTYTATTGGTYTVKAFSGACFSPASNSIPVTVLPSPIAAISPFGTMSICNGSSQTLTASSAGTGGSYLWSTGQTTQTISVSTTGTYTVMLTKSNGCSKTSNAVTVNVVSPTPEITASGPISFCTGDSVVLSTDSFASYLWSNGETTRSIKVFTSGEYYVTVTDASGCSGNSDTVHVTVNSLPLADAGPDQTIYIGYGPNDAVLHAANPGYSYNCIWSTGETTSQITVSPTVTTNYTVTVQDINSCQASDAVTVNVVDIRCDENTDKVYICHADPEHGGNTLCVSPSAVAAHLSHGDQLGACAAQASKLVYTTTHDLPDGIFPNPSDGSAFSLIINNCVDTELQVKIYDMNLKECHMQNFTVNESHRLNTKLHPVTKLPPGVYIITARGEKSQYNFKLVINN